MRSATTSLPCEPGSVPTARRWARATLTSWGLPDTGWSAAQVVSELATNVTLHARSGFVLRLSVDGSRLRVEVEDRSPVTLQARQYGPTATTGRGLHIVETLSLEWGATPHDGGKTVWALLPLEQEGDGGPRGSSADAVAAPTRAPAPSTRGAA